MCVSGELSVGLSVDRISIMWCVLLCTIYVLSVVIYVVLNEDGDNTRNEKHPRR